MKDDSAIYIIAMFAGLIALFLGLRLFFCYVTYRNCPSASSTGSGSTRAGHL